MLLCQDGATPLVLAAQMSRVELCAFLLGRGASVNIQDNEGRYWTEIFIPPLLMVKQHLSKQSQIEHGTRNGITVKTVLTDWLVAAATLMQRSKTGVILLLLLKS